MIFILKSVIYPNWLNYNVLHYSLSKYFIDLSIFIDTFIFVLMRMPHKVTKTPLYYARNLTTISTLYFNYTHHAQYSEICQIQITHSTQRLLSLHALVPGLRSTQKISSPSRTSTPSSTQSYRASTPEDALAIAQRVMSQTSKSKPFVDIIIKAQVHAGGRGKGIFKESALRGGVQTATKPSEVHDFA